MARENFLFTSESVTEGHPDKIADQISDAVLDCIIKEDPRCRVACETLVTTGLAFVAGEISTNCYVEISDVVRKTIKKIGYTQSNYGFDYETCSVITSIHSQSGDISQGVSKGEGLHQEQGAGDQGLMFGYATDETPEMMPMPILLAHKLTRQLTRARKENLLPYLRPDGKSQVTVEYRDGKPVRIDTVVISTQHAPDATYRQITDDMIEKIIKPVLPPELLDEENIKYYINPTGRFVMGGPMADTGLTGRKIIVDTYGGVGSHGGGAFSGKDPSKVDRTASYMARYMAKNLVAAGIAGKCEVQMAYAIGCPYPVSILVDTFNTGRVPQEKIEKLVRNEDWFPLTPEGMIRKLDLLRPIFEKTAAYGHFGRTDPDFTWEQTDLAETLRREAGL